MKVRVTAYARIREIIGAAALERSLPEGSTVNDLYGALAAEHPALRALQGSTRFARGDAFVSGSETLRENDDVALLPPFGGG